MKSKKNFFLLILFCLNKLISRKIGITKKNLETIGVSMFLIVVATDMQAQGNVNVDFGNKVGVGYSSVFGANGGDLGIATSPYDTYKKNGFNIVRLGSKLQDILPTGYTTIANYKASMQSGVGVSNQANWNWWNNPLIDRYYNAGYTILVTIGYTPTWLAYNSSDNHSLPQDWEVWQDIVKKYMQHYGNKISFLEVWNEPDGGFLSVAGSPYTYQLDGYKALYNNTATAIRAVNSSVQIGGYAEAGSAGIWWLNSMLDDTMIYNNFNFVSYHNYKPFSDGTTWDTQRWKTALANRGKSNVPIFITEWNWDAYSGSMNNSNTMAVSYIGYGLVQMIKEGVKAGFLYGVNTKNNDAIWYTEDNGIYNPSLSTWRLMCVQGGLSAGDFNFYSTTFSGLSNVLSTKNSNGDYLIVLVNNSASTISTNVTMTNLDFSGNVTAGIFEASATNNATTARSTAILNVTNGSTSTSLTMPGYSVVSLNLGNINNSGFETGDLTGWSTWSNNNNDAIYVESNGHLSNYHLTHFKNTAYQASTYKLITGLQNGMYDLNAWVQCGGGQNTCQLFAKDFGGTEKDATITTTNGWTQKQITGIQVTNGQCNVGLWSDGNVGNWCHMDDVSLMKSGVNLVTNPGFESGYSYWTNCGTAITTNPNTGSYYVKVNPGSSTSQDISGLLPNTKYTLTAWVKVANGSTGYLGVKNFGGTETNITTTSTIYTQLSVDFTTGASSTSATIYLWNGLGTEQIYGDDFYVTMSNNLVSNPGLENGSIGWNYFTGSINTTQQLTGAKCVQVNSGQTVEQVITGLESNTKYTVTGWVKVANGGVGSFNVTLFGGPPNNDWIGMDMTNNSYTQHSFDFTTGSNSSSAKILLWNTSSVGQAYGDDFCVTKTNPTNLVNNPGFENGYTGWSSYGTATAEMRMQRTESFCTQVNAGCSSEQVISVSPNTRYILTAWVKGSMGCTGMIGVKEFNGNGGTINDVTNSTTNNTTYSPLSVTFTTASTCTQVKIFLYNSSGSGQVYGDDFIVSGTTGVQSIKRIKTDISELNEKADVFGIYPNPASDYIHVKNITSEALLYAFSMNGQLVLTKKLTNYDNKIDVRSMGNGFYSIKVVNRQNVYSKKLIINR